MGLTSTYPPLWSKGQEGIDSYRYTLNDEVRWQELLMTRLQLEATKTHTLGEKREVNWMVDTAHAHQQMGQVMIRWIGVEQVISHYNVRKRGTCWFNKSNRSRYELDGFLMRKGESHRVARKLEVVEEISMPDHKPVTLLIRLPERKRIARRIRFNSNINWEKIKDKKEAFKYNKKTQELSNSITENSYWSEIAGILSKAALEICGKKTRHIANPRTLGKKDQLAKLHSDISKAATARNKALS